QLATIEEIQDPQEKESTLTGLNGWLATFRSHAIESEQSQKLKAELIKFEAELFEKKQNHVMTYVNEAGDDTEGSLPVLGSTIRTNSNEKVRLSAHQTLLGLEQWLLANGFIELIKKRNQFAQSLGFKTFFDYSVVKTEQMTTEQLFTILDDFEVRTRDNHQQSLESLTQKKGQSALEAHNFTYSFSGDVMNDLDPYVPFSKSLRRWVESFGRLNIEYSQATLKLDLLDRKGKYP
ncbi:peptidase M3, partial [Vibrio sp. 10N.222.48.A3]